MAVKRIGTSRLILRRWERSDLEALFQLLKDEEVNTFLPWYPVRSPEEAEAFRWQRFAEAPYAYALCRKADDRPVGYIRADAGEGHDLGYALAKEFWHQGLMTEAGAALIPVLKREGLPYLTATHDRNNPRSGGVMRQLGMKYCYSYEEQWQPKDIPVIFRMYQLNLDGDPDRVLRKYWDLSRNRFVEPGL